MALSKSEMEVQREKMKNYWTIDGIQMIKEEIYYQSKEKVIRKAPL